jgi:glycosyltransferase involved in cell wall biosynthesis
MKASAIVLLGKRDEPTDAVAEYCEFLGKALCARGIYIESVRLPWADRGWHAALGEFRQEARSWRGKWVVVQYTALSWSARGFPLRFIRVMKILREAGARPAVVFHDVEPYGGERAVDQLRRRAQLHTMQRALHYADLGVFTVALGTVSWLRDPLAKAVFIPVGANLPAVVESTERKEGLLCVAIFGITGGTKGRQEAAQIVEAVRFAATKMGKLRLHAFGRHANDCEAQLRESLRGLPVEVQVEGVLPRERVVEALTAADVMLFVRAPISSRRGSAIAGIACGLPVVGYGGPDTAAPVTDAGVVLVDREKQTGLGEALVRVLEDRDYRAALAKRSQAAQARYFAWDAIAARYVEALSK